MVRRLDLPLQQMIEFVAKSFKRELPTHSMEKELTADLSLAELTEKDRKIVNVTKMEEYLVIFFNVESQILLYWKEHPHLKDKKVIFTFKKLEKNFDNHKETSLAGRISRAVKEGLIQSKKEENKSYTYGEVISCIKLLKKIAKIHKSPNGRGYLYWVEAFFEDRLPETKEEMREYIWFHES